MQGHMGEQMVEQIDCDVLVVGGGVNGVGIARDAAGRGLRVVLCEKDDLASHTSSASSKLVHGGLRYLEQYQFALVRKALVERERLLQSAPHIMWPLSFVMPHDSGQRPAWLIRAGLLLYDGLARRAFLPRSRAVDLRRHSAGAPLQPQFVRGFEYADGWVDDARLVALTALDAAERGATILTRTACTEVQRHPLHWQATLTSATRTRQVNARCLVDASGPWAGRLLAAGVVAAGAAVAPRLVKGSHIVVPRLFDHPRGYIFQHPDGRIVFALPYEEKFTLIGTTDVEFAGALDDVAISAAETDYLCALANRYFRAQISAADVVWSFAGVRPLAAPSADSAQDASRDFQLVWDAGHSPGNSSAAAVLTVLGGKITTFRTLAEQAVDLIAAALGNQHGHWSAAACLPGGDLFGPLPNRRAVLEYDSWADSILARYRFLSPPLVRRYARAYGTRIHLLLEGCRASADLGPQIVSGLFAVEADYLMRHEWAVCGADILWRRTKLGLHAHAGAEALVDAWIARRASQVSAGRLPQPA
ncbi:glycerol-3-phosphate dehydrogenase [Massilia sp. PWRC2]|uniref:glycerol-3-phosphate dehydrogenase n=1 Tax=Massilia sp. PWRC2 TaxID=2804626 RepID=UPI003CEB9E59